MKGVDEAAPNVLLHISKIMTSPPTCVWGSSSCSFPSRAAQWSTCKIPVMRDVDLHTFWGSSALRVAAYVIKSPSNGAATPHLQSTLEYVFCVQVYVVLSLVDPQGE